MTTKSIAKCDIDLDDLLESALEDFDDDTLSEKSSDIADLASDARSAFDLTTKNDEKKMQENMSKLIEDLRNTDLQNSLESSFKNINKEQDKFKTLSKPVRDVDKGVAETLQHMSAISSECDGMNSANVEEMGEEIMNDMMKQFEEIGEKEDFQGMIDNMMQQLMSKDVMYDPMKQICQKYPEWLAEQEAHLSVEDYERYGRQYGYFQQIVAVYENEPENYTRLTELMQEMQEYGQPPAEIVKELAPGLEFDSEGMPIMPNMGNGTMPNIPGLPPGMALPGQEQCSLM